jgi:hypothetical protein
MNVDMLDLPKPLKLAERARLVTLKDNETARRLVEAAAKDNHLVIAPTHVMMRGEQIIGYLSLGALPVVQAWFDSQCGHALDSLKMIEMGEAIFDTQGVKQFAVACAEISPFMPHMERLGFKELGKTTLWVKTL